MNDRACNEKKANEVLDNWRKEKLQECNGDQDHTEVHHFYCMAHVLLGFHSYCCKDLKSYLVTLDDEYGPLEGQTSQFSNTGATNLQHLNVW
jgi:hypothetical protein